ncbi:anti-virulence regulator CigR family protein [Achromobacter sp. B7]|uniref:anti-virulence regulator CigR family protein n=1 Tax=Achromobacter sp. B7 TaxID=2282475 RepID=UPI0013C50009|nr:anti-virulence regulator CigR family protein [Achromobacter sp. B7]
MRTTVRLLTIACSLALGAHAFAAPPEGKGKPDKSDQGQGQGQGQGKNKGQGQGDSGDKNGKSNSGNGNGNGNGNGKGKGKGNGGDDSLRQAGISVTTARGYATEYHVTGYAPLPPGIRKNLARGKPLPPGIAKKMVPGPMLARLPVYPGYEWRVAGSDLVLVAIATAVVADILVNVFD